MMQFVVFQQIPGIVNQVVQAVGMLINFNLKLLSVYTTINSQNIDWIDEIQIKRYLFIFGITLIVFYLFLIVCLIKYGI